MHNTIHLFKLQVNKKNTFEKTGKDLTTLICDFKTAEQFHEFENNYPIKLLEFDYTTKKV